MTSNSAGNKKSFGRFINYILELKESKVTKNCMFFGTSKEPQGGFFFLSPIYLKKSSVLL